jgi:cyanate permease
MKFKDTKVIHVGRRPFEHARVVQGVAIYTVVFGLMGFCLLSGKSEVVLAILGVLTILFLLIAQYYIHKGNSTREATLLALLKLLVLPTSMLG